MLIKQTMQKLCNIFSKDYGKMFFLSAKAPQKNDCNNQMPLYLQYN